MQEFGYTVLEAIDGEDAVKTFQERADKVQRLLCNLMMLKKNGKETLEEIRKKSQDMRGLVPLCTPLKHKGILPKNSLVLSSRHGNHDP